MANLKIIAIVVVIVLVIAGVGVVLLSNSTEKRTEEINLVTGLEAVGSGIYYDKSKIDPSNLFVTDAHGDVELDSSGNVKYRAAGWNQLIVGSPGIISIQHIQLKTIVEIYLSDASKVDGPTKSYKLVAWTQGQDLKDGEVGYVVTGGGATGIIGTNVSGQSLAIGLTWQPQLVKVDADPKYDVLVRTNELFPNQTCCVTIANQSFIQSHPDVAERVIWAIVQGAEWLNQAKEKGKTNPNDADYQKLLQIGATIAGQNFTTDDLKVAIEDVEYDWGDVNANVNSPLTKLKSDVAIQAEDLYRTKDARYSASELGFSSYLDYANGLVDDSILKKVLSNGISNKPTFDSRYKVRFVFIEGDIHQLPLHIANNVLPGQTQSYFDQVGIDFERIGVSIGSAVVAALKANEADFGVSGQPSIIVDNINNKLTTADTLKSRTSANVIDPFNFGTEAAKA
ncbi:MAG: hypothetical protein LBS92_06080 [Candidatus Methanoplasma sp.]|jgi:ABC-type nitrate/sulfonate/bicarbonate transport system substrate-binding protein|nr:hypothetical protein [Candidatus Methanoplasma sp.]